MPRTTTTPPASSDGAAPKAATRSRTASKATAKAPAKAKGGKATDEAPEAQAKHEAPAKPAAKPASRPAATKPAAPGRLPGRGLAEPAPVALVDADDEPEEVFLGRQRQALLEERETYVEQARLLRAEAESLVQEAEPGDVQFDEESGEGGTTTVDRERDLALSAQALAAVEEIDVALEKIESGRYGICEGCGQRIPRPRLEALPYARLCIACKSGGLSRR